MGLYLVTAHQTASSADLLDQLQMLVAKDSAAEFVLLVPATRVSHMWTWIEGGEYENARYRAGQAASAMREAGLKLIDTIIGPADPIEAVQHELSQRDRSYEAVVVSTLPQGMSHWLRLDVPNQLRRRCGVKVISVVSRGVRPAKSPTIAATPRQDTRTWQHLDLGALAALRGTEIYCLDGKLGTLTQLLYDYVTQEPVWMAVSSRPLPFRTLLLPAQASRMDAGHLLVPFEKAKILSQPHVDIGEGIPSITDEARLYDYFGLTQDRIRELRVLHGRDDLPGGEVNWQRIFENDAVMQSSSSRRA